MATRAYSTCPSCIPARRALMTDGRWKYIWRPATGAEQLFDLANDPRELREVTVRARRELWRERLVGQLRHRPEGFTDGSRLRPGRPYPPLVPGRDVV